MSLGVTLIVPPGQEATGVYEAEGGIPVFITDEPYLVANGLISPLPVKVVDGPVYADSVGNAQSSLAVSGLPE